MKQRKKALSLIIACILLVNITAITSAATAIGGVPDVDVVLLNQDPDPVEQGDVVEVRFKVENTGTATLDDVELKLLPSYPFTIYSGTATRNIGKLKSSLTGADAAIIDYKLRVDKDAAEGENEIELEVNTGTMTKTYDDGEFMIDIEQYNVPELNVYIKENNILQPNTKGTIAIEVANVDLGDVEFLQMTLLPSEDYKLLSSSDYVYIGNVDSDDTDSEDFEIYVKDVEDGEVSVPIKIEYQDSNEKEYEKTIDLKFSVYSSRDLKKYGLKETNYTGIIILAILAIIVYFYWRRKNRKNKKHA
ncbi:hypothetical protein GF378_03465 [Candidatus Pacearchaeota archaeon]|nr:hypothetical protein [Candidatus Pacearchaeota archaeon]